MQARVERLDIFAVCVRLLCQEGDQFEDIHVLVLVDEVDDVQAIGNEDTLECCQSFYRHRHLLDNCTIKKGRTFEDVQGKHIDGFVLKIFESIYAQ